MRVSLLRPVLGALGLTQIRHVAAVRRRRAAASVARVYRDMELEFGVLIPPVALHAQSPDVLAATWLLLRETLIVPGAAPRAAKEAVATAVSLGNACPYCATIHHNALAVIGLPGVSDVDGPVGGRAQPELESLAEWVLADQRGAGIEAPFPPSQTAQMVGVAVMMHYLNRMVNVFLRDVPLPPGVPEVALRPVLWLLGRAMLRASRSPCLAGSSLDLLPAATLPSDLRWAADDEPVAEAFARACAAIEAAGRRSVPEEVRAMVADNLLQWRGGLRGMSRRWVDELVTGLPPQQRPAGRLALLTAFASYQVDEQVIAAARESGADDRMLVDLCAWAAMAAARRMGGLLRLPVGIPKRTVWPESKGFRL